MTKENKEFNLRIVSLILPSKFVIRDSTVRPARNAFDEVRGNAMMDLSNQNASFTPVALHGRRVFDCLRKM